MRTVRVDYIVALYMRFRPKLARFTNSECSSDNRLLSESIGFEAATSDQLKFFPSLSLLYLRLEPSHLVI
jgi:hypothetical protein